MVIAEWPLFGDGACNSSQVKAEIDPDGPRAVKVEHVYSRGHHTFYFSASDRGLIKDCQINITPLSVLESDAIYCTLPPRSVRANR